MDFIDQIRSLSTRIANTKDIIQTEEATKNAMVMPFIQTLGYNVFDPLEVTPELVADVGTKKGEKVDYAILSGGKPIMLFECKKSGADLNVSHASQLFRYFHVTEARFGVLTNGIRYQFFTDLEQPNKMDERPFLEFNILDFKDPEVEELKKFAKASFDVDTILTTANDLKYTRIIQNQLAEWMDSPSEDFVRLLVSDHLAGKRFTPAVKEQFTAYTKRAFKQLLSTRINDRLRSAMAPEQAAEVAATPSAEALPDNAEARNDTETIVTTIEEIEGFHIIRAILRDVLPSKRVVMRDAKSYCAILVDDNNRKPVCRLHFNNTARLVVGLMDAEKNEERVQLADLDELYNYADRLRATAQSYL